MTLATKYAYTDGGRVAAGFTRERNDCAVRALVESLEVPYADAHAYLKSRGRRDGGRTHNTLESYDAVQFGGRRLQRTFTAIYRRELKTVSWWLASGRLPKRAVVHIRGHVMAIVDGVIRDSWEPGLRARVRTIWEVISV